MGSERTKMAEIGLCPWSPDFAQWIWVHLGPGVQPVQLSSSASSSFLWEKMIPMQQYFHRGQQLQAITFTIFIFPPTYHENSWSLSPLDPLDPLESLVCQVDARTSPEMVALCDPYDCGINAFFVPGARLAATTCLFLEQEEPRPCQAGHLWRLGIRWDVCHWMSAMFRYPIGNHGLSLNMFNLWIKGFLMVSVNFTFKHINST